MTRRIQWVRFAIRISIVLMAVGIALVSQYRIVVARGGFEGFRSSEDWSSAHTVLNAVDAVLIGEAREESDESERLQRRQLIAGRLSQVRGDSWSLDLFGLSLTDPLAGLEAIFAGKRLVPAILIGITIPVCVALILGRVFCSWICPAGLLFEVGDWARRKLSSRPGERSKLKVWRGNKYVLLAFGLLMSAIAGIPLLGAIYPPALMMREIHSFVASFFRGVWQEEYNVGMLVLSGSTLLLLGILLFEIFVAPRFWCRSLCPGGALQSLLGKFRLVRIRNEFSLCSKCTACVKACPMELDPMSKRLGMECDSCLLCVSACESQSLRLTPRRFLNEIQKGELP